jgi:hypothetical protein
VTQRPAGIKPKIAALWTGCFKTLIPKKCPHKSKAGGKREKPPGRTRARWLCRCCRAVMTVPFYTLKAFTTGRIGSTDFRFTGKSGKTSRKKAAFSRTAQTCGRFMAGLRLLCSHDPAHNCNQ